MNCVNGVFQGNAQDVFALPWKIIFASNKTQFRVWMGFGGPLDTLPPAQGTLSSEWSPAGPAGCPVEPSPAPLVQWYMWISSIWSLSPSFHSIQKVKLNFNSRKLLCESLKWWNSDSKSGSVKKVPSALCSPLTTIPACHTSTDRFLQMCTKVSRACGKCGEIHKAGKIL